MKRILVPFDFSRPAIDAYRIALDIAIKSRGTVHLLHAIELPIVHDTVMTPVMTFEAELLKELKEDAEERFEKLVKKYGKAEVTSSFSVEFGNVSRVIYDYVRQHAMDIVIMGSHGASGLRETFVGSNAERVVRNSPVPVLVIKKYFMGPIKHIVLPHALEIKGEDEFMAELKSLQEFFQARLHVVRINTPANFVGDNITNERLQAFARHFALKNYTLNIFSYPDEEQGILEFAKSVNADLIAIGTHGRKGIAHLLNGSLAEDVANHSNGLVWTCALANRAVEA